MAWACAAFVALLLAFGAVAVQTHSLVKHELTDVVMARREAVTQLAAATLSERLDRMVDVAVSLATRVRFAELVAAGQWDRAVQILRGVPSDFRFVDRVVIHDVHGTVMADVPELAGARGENRADRDWYRGVSRSWKPYVSEVYRRGAMPQRHVFAVAVPIVDRNAAPAGILQLQIDLEHFFDWARAINVGTEGSTYVIDGKGTAAFHSGIPVAEQLVNFSKKPSVARLLRGQAGVELIADPAGAEQIYAFTPGRHGWGVVVQQPAIKAFEARDDQLRRLLVGYGVIMLFCAATVVLSIILLWQQRRVREGERAKAELERRVAERLQDLDVVSKELESFSYSVSHDLRSPLRAIDGYALMLQDDYAERLDDEGRRLLGTVRESAKLMGRLIDDLLRFSQVGRKPLAMAPLDMRALAGEVAAELQQAYPAARVELGNLPAATGDRALLRHVWMNLIGNALKYSARRDPPRAEIGGRGEPAECLYWVRDNGAGFDMRYYGKLFKVFQRLHRDEEFEGTGVGLAIAQRVILRHGGRLWGEGAVGKGACFYFALPKEA